MEPEESWECFGCFTYADSQLEKCFQKDDGQAKEKNSTVSFDIHGGTGDHKDGKNLPNFWRRKKTFSRETSKKI